MRAVLPADAETPASAGRGPQAAGSVARRRRSSVRLCLSDAGLRESTRPFVRGFLFTSPPAPQELIGTLPVHLAWSGRAAEHLVGRSQFTEIAGQGVQLVLLVRWEIGRYRGRPLGLEGLW